MASRWRFVGLIVLLSLLLLGCGGLFDEDRARGEATARALATDVARAVTGTQPANGDSSDGESSASGSIGGGEEETAPVVSEGEQKPSGAGGGISQDESRDTGGIAGNLAYPSDFVPPLRIIAFATDGSGWYEARTKMDEMTYVLEGLPPGAYNVVAYAEDGSGQLSGLAGGYSEMVPCGLSADCTDHTLIAVTVTAGDTTRGVDPLDWYAPDGAWPEYPG